MASEALIRRAIVARARNYGLDVEEERCDVELLASTVGKLDALGVDDVTAEQINRLVAALNEGGSWEDAWEFARRPMRRATVKAVRSRREVEAYLPTNYEVVGELPSDRVEGRVDVMVEGYDDRGWTLDGYVIPRLRSGLMFAEETT